jgi:uncharacterized coiled-coil DUF342 family protein
MSEELHQLLGEINKKLERLLTLKRDVDELRKRTKEIEELLFDYVLVLSDEEKTDLDEALKEYAESKTTSLEEAERILGV